MKTLPSTLTAAMMGAAGLMGLAGAAHAQSSDALIDKLVDKGILTVKEANELRDESDKDFTKAYQVKSGMPDWVTSLRINGDLRLRYDGIYNNDPLFQSDRNRLRYRLRFGMVASIVDNFEVGIRLTSAEAPDANLNQADPISGNSTFSGNGSKKPIWIDLAYLRWSAVNTGDFGWTMVGGKMENPFVVDDMVFDADYTPEGYASQFTWNATQNHSVKFNVGGFSLREESASSHDTYLGGAQLRLDSTWSPRISTSLGLSGFALTGKEKLVTAAVPDKNTGNTRVGAAGALANDFNPFVADASLTYTLDSFPFYPGAFPIRFFGEYMNNPAAAVSPNGAGGRIYNQAYNAGLTLGKSGKKGTWDLTYRWKHLEGDAWYEELVDSDHGAMYYKAGAPATLGYGSGTNLRGHFVRANYSPTDALTLGVTYYLFSLINTTPGTPAYDSLTGRLQVDLIWKF